MNRYHLDSVAGEGSFATVFRCRHVESGKPYALKRFRKKCNDWESACDIIEIRALLSVRGQPNIVQIFELGREKDGTVFFTMELYQGSLFDLIRQERALSEEVVQSLVHQILKGLDALHKCGYVHRDLKPENILVSEVFTPTEISSIELKICLADLGSATKVETAPLTNYITTRFYRSPEMVLKDPQYGPKVDVWAAGCVAFEAFTGFPLFPAQAESELILRMCSVLGSPPIEDSRFKRMVNINIAHIPTMFPKQSIRRCFDGADRKFPSDGFISILEKLIKWIPEDRLDCATALRTEPFLQIRGVLHAENV